MAESGNESKLCQLTGDLDIAPVLSPSEGHNGYVLPGVAFGVGVQQFAAFDGNIQHNR